MLSNRRHMTLIVRSFTSVVILKKEFAFIAEKDLQTKLEVMRDITQTVESMLSTNVGMSEILSTGLSPAALAATLETFIRSMMDQVTGLASLVTDSDAVGKLVTAPALTTGPQPHRFDDEELGYGE